MSSCVLTTHDERRFGSAHAGGCFFVFCDGHVAFISESIDAEVHRRNGNRRDGSARRSGRQCLPAGSLRPCPG
ncbi:MAG: DUF1559 domain-containing protein [Candidatus Dadabacteria bacterium]|nr:MAG: DUF1559 domain-containing protein [Candidatus Dadabacteria bacterium]